MMQTDMKPVSVAPFSIAGGIREHLQDSLERLTRTLGLLETWRLRHKRRMQFAGLDPRILRDAGIGDAQRFLVANRPFWEA